MKRTVLIFAIIVFFFSIFLCLGAEPIKLNLVSAWPIGDMDNIGLEILEEKIIELGNGKIILNRVGGPETIPPFELAEAVGNGAIDMAWLVPAYYTDYLPEANVLDYSDYGFSELIESGGIDYLNKIHHDKMNIHIIGSGDNGLGYSIYTTEPVTSIKDFKGMRIRISGSYLPFLRALEAETVLMPTGEIYSALERGVIKGFTSPAVGISARKLDEITKYVILPYYWRVVDVSIMNLDKWNSLPEDVKEILIKASREVEINLPKAIREIKEKEDKALKDRGIEFITIKEKDEYLQIAAQSGKARIQEIVGADNKLISFFFK